MHMGDIVLVHEDLKHRHLWRTGRIEELRRRWDDRVRTCILHMPNQTLLTRPIQLILPLERAIKVGRM